MTTHITHPLPTLEPLFSFVRKTCRIIERWPVHAEFGRLRSAPRMLPFRIALPRVLLCRQPDGTAQ